MAKGPQLFLLIRVSQKRAAFEILLFITKLEGNETIIDELLIYECLTSKLFAQTLLQVGISNIKRLLKNNNSSGVSSHFPFSLL